MCYVAGGRDAQRFFYLPHGSRALLSSKDLGASPNEMPTQDCRAVSPKQHIQRQHWISALFYGGQIEPELLLRFKMAYHVPDQSTTYSHFEYVPSPRYGWRMISLLLVADWLKITLRRSLCEAIMPSSLVRVSILSSSYVLNTHHGKAVLEEKYTVMTHQEACRPCARRKVRCDKQEPNCTNCKRRKGDRCVYPPISPNERIRRLEALVRKLGGDPSNGGSTAVNNKQAPAQSSGAQLQVGNVADAPIEIRSADPIVLEEDGHTFYVESRVWQDWLGKGTSKNSFMSHKRPHALSDQISSYQRNHDLSITHPHLEQASMLWTVFYQRVEPLVRITFRWQLKELQDRSLNADRLKDFSDAEHALVIAIYLVSIVSLLDDECDDLLHESRFSLISRYHALCEESLLLANIFCMVDVTVIKAVVFYMVCVS